MSGNGELQISQPARLNLLVEWSPETGKVDVSFPQANDIVKLQLVSIAIQALIEVMSREAQSRIAVPAIALPPGTRLT
jgi:hypothetical protein